MKPIAEQLKDALALNKYATIEAINAYVEAFEQLEMAGVMLRATRELVVQRERELVNRQADLADAREALRAAIGSLEKEIK